MESIINYFEKISCPYMENYKFRNFQNIIVYEVDYLIPGAIIKIITKKMRDNELLSICEKIRKLYSGKIYIYAPYTCITINMIFKCIENIYVINKVDHIFPEDFYYFTNSDRFFKYLISDKNINYDEQKKIYFGRIVSTKKCIQKILKTLKIHKLKKISELNIFIADDFSFMKNPVFINMNKDRIINNDYVFINFDCKN